VSAGNSVAAGAAGGTGLPMAVFQNVMMVFKILPTRVGAGPFPSEIWNRQQAELFAIDHPPLYADSDERRQLLSTYRELINAGKAEPHQVSTYFQVLYNERGTTTGRGRSVGYPDIPWLRYAIQVNGPRWLCMTRLDGLSGLKEIPVVVEYKLDGKTLLPGQMPGPLDIHRIETVTEIWPCWDENVGECRRKEELPIKMREFISEFEHRVGVHIPLVGIGPQRDAMIVRS
jgi:adenylosuccinate synthase